MFAIGTCKKLNIIGVAPKVCLKQVPGGPPVPIPTPVKASGSDADKGKCTKKIWIANAKVVVENTKIKKSPPPNPAGKPPDLKGIISHGDQGGAKNIKVIATVVTMHGKNPVHVTCPYMLNIGSPGDSGGPTGSGDSTATTTPVGGGGGSGGGGTGPGGSLTIIGDPAQYSASEIRAANYMKDRGHQVVLRPPTGTRKGGGTSDLLVDGINYDVYTPKTANPNRIISAMAKKNQQTSGIVLDLAQSPATADKLGDALARVRGSGATNITDIVVLPK